MEKTFCCFDFSLELCIDFSFCFRLHDELLGFRSNLVVDEKRDSEEPQTFASGTFAYFFSLRFIVQSHFPFSNLI